MPKKELGQHWLFDEASLSAVADAGQILPNDRVVEIGPGLGTLTCVLISRGAKVTAVEYDQELAVELKNSIIQQNSRFQGRYLETSLEEAVAGIKVVNEDILQFDFSNMQTPYKVVGNIPYYLTSKLIRNLLELENQPQAIGLLIQKEVAQRIVAKPGKMSILSVAAQLYAECSLGPEVPARLFTPPPKVDSQVVQLIPKKTQKIDYKQFFRVVKAGFGERRKKLANSLSGGLQIEKIKVEAVLQDFGWSANVRAQELSVEDWLQLYKQIDS